MQGAYNMTKIPAKIISLIKKFKNKIITELDVKKVLIFGSYAKGNYTINSDIDVCVIAQNIENNYLTMLQIAPKIIDIDTRIEPVVFSFDEYQNQETYGLLKEIKKYGIEI